MFGMSAVDRDGVRKPVLKPTRWMSNAPMLLHRLSRRCEGRHAEHARLLGGRVAGVAIYPPGLVIAIVKGLQDQRELDARRGKEDCPLSQAIKAAIDDDPDDDPRMIMAPLALGLFFLSQAVGAHVMRGISPVLATLSVECF